MSKPILSELEYNASDVASAILASADLSVTNQDFGVTDVSSSFVLDSNWTSEYSPQCFAFNGFCFISFACKKDNAAHNDVVMNVGSDYRPESNTPIGSSAHEGDTPKWLLFRTDGVVELNFPENEGGSDFHLVINGWYRIG